MPDRAFPPWQRYTQGYAWLKDFSLDAAAYDRMLQRGMPAHVSAHSAHAVTPRSLGSEVLSQLDVQEVVAKYVLPEKVTFVFGQRLHTGVNRESWPSGFGCGLMTVLELAARHPVAQLDRASSDGAQRGILMHMQSVVREAMRLHALSWSMTPEYPKGFKLMADRKSVV